MRKGLEQVDLITRLVESNRDSMVLATSADGEKTHPLFVTLDLL